MQEIDPKTLHFPETHVVGPWVRTTNQDEASGKGKIGALWQRFFQEGLAARIEPKAHPTRILAVYTSYESDHRGAYTLVVGCPVSARPKAPPEGMLAVTIPAGDYLVFEARGEMPRALIETWGTVWRRFESGRGRRAFTTDFEVHDPTLPEEATIHIALAS